VLPEGNRLRAVAAPLELSGVSSLGDAMDVLFA
jgi:hypothetical protein